MAGAGAGVGHRGAGPRVRVVPPASIVGLSAATPGFTTMGVRLLAPLLSGLGGMLAEQTKTITKRDALVAITYLTSPEGAENPEQEATDAVLTSVKRLGAKSILITDSLLMPMANKATISIETRDFNAPAFRSITAAMCVSQTIASALSDRSD